MYGCACGSAGGQPALNQRMTVLARDSTTFVKESGALVRLFDKSDDAAKQALSEFTLARAFLFIQMRGGIFEPIGMRMRAQFFPNAR